MPAATRRPGPAALRVAASLRRLRDYKRLSTYELSDQMASTGTRISASSITQAELGARRVDADDLVALAAALGCSPNRLIMPEADSFLSLARETEVTPGVTVTAARAWAWACGEERLDGAGMLADVSFAQANRPHRFARETPASAAALTDLADLARLAAAALAHGATPGELRTALEMAMGDAIIARRGGIPSQG